MILLRDERCHQCIEPVPACLAVRCFIGIVVSHLPKNCCLPFSSGTPEEKGQGDEEEKTDNMYRSLAPFGLLCFRNVEKCWVEK